MLQCTILSSIGQTFINGDFEINSVTNCMIEINNSTFNSVMSNVKGIGELQTLDIFYYKDCPTYDSAHSGDFYVSLENTNHSNKSTAISLKLADTLQVGLQYTFCYYDRGFTLHNGQVEIGISNNDSTFGSLIYVSATCDTIWRQRTVSFMAPITGNFITARYKHSPPPYDGLLIDNFGICQSNGINEEFILYSYKIFPNPFSNLLTFTSSKSDQTTIVLYNYLGQQILQQSFTDSISINTLQLATGIYIYQLRSSKRIVANGKVVKN